jgi:preprotein translocase subunit SecG
MEKVILVVHVLTALAIIGLILLQQGKGAEAGASFGAGASQTVFGSQGSGNFFTRATAILAAVFFVTSFGLAVMAKQQASVGATAGVPIVDEAAAIPTLLEQGAEEIPAELPAVEEGQAELPVVPDGDLPQ